MVRFKDKQQISNASLTDTDIMPITDMEDSSNDKKVTVGQLKEYFGNNISTFATKDLANTDMLVDAILEAPNGVIEANTAKNAVLVKNGLKVLFASGRQTNGKLKNTEYTVTTDKTQSTTNIADGHYVVFINSSGSIVYTLISQVYVARVQPKVTTTTAYWYDIESNYWKITNNTGSTWTNTVINNLGQFKVASGLVTEVISNTPIYIPSPEAIMVRDLSNITPSGQQDIKDIVKPELDTKQDKLIAGTGISIENNIISNTQTSAEWGNIDGNIDDQEDLKNKLAVQNMYTTGNVSTDTQGYNQLLEMKHSTFDKSKFTIVGSPTITDDGIASGFSASDYINIPVLDLSSNDFEIDIKYTHNSANAIQTLYRCATNAYAGTFGFLLATDVNNKLYLSTATYIMNTALEDGVTYDIKLKINNSVAKVYVNNAEAISMDWALSIPTAYLTLGANATQWETQGSIDLSQFSITVDGKEVFSGNKTGIDTIKADNYEVVGSLTISDDGVASGFSNNSYLVTKLTSDITYENDFEISIVINVPEILSHEEIFIKELNNNNGLSFKVTLAKMLQIYSAPSINSWTNALVSPLSTGLNLIKLKKTGTNLKVSANDKLTKTFTLGGLNSIDNLVLGSRGDQYFLTGSIDLNSFKIYVDGNLVYQPCLKIPYTQSKTGSKIVDVAYRDRVQDLYEQTGTASYYTIDETNQNFTLPMGEIYGMIESKGSKATGGGLELCDIGTALYVNESKGLRRRLNGSIMDITSNYQAFLIRLQEITTLYPNLVCTETEWQSIKTASKIGQCGKFVYNYADDGTTVTSVRLPAAVNINGLADMTKAGLIKDQTLPNITGNLSITSHFQTDGAFESSGSISSLTGASSGGGVQQATFDASRSSSTYQDDAPVQQEAIQYPYFIQVATGQETENNIVNDIELNNPYVLFKSEYFEAPPYNISWLKSDGEYKPKATYPKAYEALMVEQNTDIEAGTTVDLPSGTKYTKRGLSVKLSTASDITDYDFVINTTDETFRLPLLNGSESLLGTTYIDYSKPVSNAIQYMPCNGRVICEFHSSAVNQAVGLVGNSNAGDGSFGQMVSKATTSNQVLYVSGDFKRGDAYNIFYDAPTFVKYRIYKAVGNGNLYYYVGETVQNANVIDAGRIGEELTNKTNAVQAAHASMPSSRYIDLTIGASGTTYTAPADGWYCLTASNEGASGSYVAFIEMSYGGRMILTAKDYSRGGACVPVQKGQSVVFNYEANVINKSIRFVYAEGVPSA